MTKDEALKIAWDALSYINEGANNQGPHTGISWRCAANKSTEALNAIKAALEAKDEPIQEPAAWISKHNVVYPLDAWHEVHPINELKPLYTNPPQRTWVGLTDEERSRIWGELPQTLNPERDACVFAETIEVYLKEKNS